MTASPGVAGEGGIPCPVAEYGLDVVARVAASRAVPKRQPWGGSDWPQRSGYEIRAEAERQTARAIRATLRDDRAGTAGAGEP
ncbi:MAG: hypothetical protein ACI9CA_002057 [Natronomonas sp.]|jgi:hypothetical protein